MDLIKNINFAFWFLGLIGCYNSLITFILFLLSHTFGQTDQKPLYSLNGITFLLHVAFGYYRFFIHNFVEMPSNKYSQEFDTY
jgi:hypothetical protein